MKPAAALAALLIAPFAQAAMVIPEEISARETLIRLPAALLAESKPSIAWVVPPRPHRVVTWGPSGKPGRQIVAPKPAFQVAAAEIAEKPPEPRPVEERRLLATLREMPDQAAFLWIAGLMIGSSLLWRTIWRPWVADAEPRYYAR